MACTVCLAPVFNSILDIRKHMKQEHSGLGMPCPHCNDIYFDQKTLRHHVRRVNHVAIHRVTVHFIMKFLNRQVSNLKRKESADISNKLWVLKLGKSMAPCRVKVPEVQNLPKILGSSTRSRSQVRRTTPGPEKSLSPATNVTVHSPSSPF